MLVSIINKSFGFEEYVDLISGSQYTLSGVKFDERRGVLKLPYNKERLDLATTIKTTWLKKTIKIPLIKGELIIENVRAIDLKDAAKLDTFFINEISCGADFIKIVSNVPIELDIEVSKIYLEFRESDEIVGHQQREIYLGMIEFDRPRDMSTDIAQ